MPKRIRIKEPDSPGKVMPETLMIPQKNIKTKLSFCVAGLRKLMDMPMIKPIIPAGTVFFPQCPKSFPM